MKQFGKRLDWLEAQAHQPGEGTGETIFIETAGMSESAVREELLAAQRSVGRFGCVIVDREVPGIVPIAWVHPDMWELIRP